MYCQSCKNEIKIGDTYFCLDNEHNFCSDDCLDEYLFYSGRLYVKVYNKAKRFTDTANPNKIELMENDGEEDKKE